MAFKDSLKNWFFHTDSSAAKAGARICLLDATGEPAGSDELLRSLSFAQCKDDYVDMGLPSGTLWAKKNLGAASETDYGMYVTWGDLEMHPKDDGYVYSQNKYDNSPAAAIGADLTLKQDIVHDVLGCGWRMPTADEFTELFNSNYTTSTWVESYRGVTLLNGRLITSKSNGNTIFLPAGGSYFNSSINSFSDGGEYWSSTYSSAANALRLSFYSGGVYTNVTQKRAYGLQIRPVI